MNALKSRFGNQLFSSADYQHLAEPATPAKLPGDRIVDPSLLEGWVVKSLAILSVLVTTVISTSIVVLQFTGYRNTGGLFQWSEDNRATVQVVVFVLSLLLGSFWTFSVCSALNFETRQYFVRRAVALHTLKLWSALSLGHYDRNLPVWSAIASLLFFLLLSLPSTAWSGALTPQSVNTSFNVTLSIPAASGNALYSTLGASNVDCWTKQQANGTFTSCPSYQFSGNLLTSAASATTPDGSPRNHSKFDNTQFRYVGRSYGVGGSVGLTDNVWASRRTTQSYTYLESGYITNTSCIYNASSLWRVTLWQKGNGPAMPDLYIANGFFPNSNWTEIYANGFATFNASEMDYSGIDGSDYFAQVAFSADKLVTIAGKAYSADDRTSQYFLAVAAGKAYSVLDKMQCEVTFHPMVFNVNVSTVDRTIEVTPQGLAADIDSTGGLKARAVRDVGSLWGATTGLSTSELGNALEDNINNYQIRNNADPAKPPLNNTVLAAVSDSMTAMIDDVLMSYGTLSLTQPNATSTTSALVTRSAVRLGDPVYCIAVMVLNGLGLVLVLIAAFHSRFWKHLPLFDYTDLASMAVASAFGAADAKGASADRLSGGVLKHWNGSPTDRVLGHVSARLEVEPMTKQLNVSLR